MSVSYFTFVPSLINSFANWLIDIYGTCLFFWYKYVLYDQSILIMAKFILSDTENLNV